MSTKIEIDVDVPVGKELLVTEHTPEHGAGKRRVQASHKVIASFKKGKGKIKWTVESPNYLTFEEYEHNDH